MFEEADVIYSYTRQQAIDDGVLIDVTETAKECGFRYPVALTTRVWTEVIVPDDEAKKYGQSESGRLWDLLWLLFVAIKTSKAPGEEIRYSVIVSDGRKRRTAQLKALCGPGDKGEPVLTIMDPAED